MEICKANWYFRRNEYLLRSPSRAKGISVADEKKLRIKGIKYIVQVCVNIKLYPLRAKFHTISPAIKNNNFKSVSSASFVAA